MSNNPSPSPGVSGRVPVAVWGTGNMGRAAVRAIVAHPGLALAGVLVHDRGKVGLDAGPLAGLESELGVRCEDDAAAVLARVAGSGALAYTASGDIRPDDAATDIARALSAGVTVVSPSLYGMYDVASAPEELRAPLASAALEGDARLFVSGIDPGWGNDLLPVLLTGLAGTIDAVRCQEIFDYTSYDQPDSVRDLVGMGHPMDYEPPMVMATVPTMVWGGQVRMIARALGVELDEIREQVERAPLTETVSNRMGEFVAGSQGGLRFEVQGIVDGEPRIIVEHVTRIDAAVAPTWPQPADGADGAHRVVIEGRPRLEVTVEASDEGGNRAAGGNATAATRLVNAIPWLLSQPAGLYDALQVPLTPGVGRLGR
ncbi:dihydrodipicolinate reductase [Nocardioides daejeonensis]|uniref:NAD(P)H-dependent amine dehydrogenase family protein n=1 Tax=Nocardioides daejeonensis TaxID=1046556 RepID=UPI000D74125A|nr:dihydrodipicolinate reductase [Nocardioides daejeonensis]